MESTLFLFTNFYPYRSGEEYLEEEIHYLCATFRKIYVCPLMVSNQEVQTRVLPKNVEICTPNLAESKKSKFLMLKHFPKALRFWKNLESEDKGSTFKQKLYALYFAMRTERLISELKPKFEAIIQKENIDVSNCVFYSYWFYITASVALGLQDCLGLKKAFCISRAHRYDVDEKAASLKFLPERRYLLNGIDYLYPVATTQCDFLKNKYLEYADKIAYAPLGVASTSCEASEDLLQTRFDYPRTLISVSGLRPIKRIPLLIQALSLLEKDETVPEWTWEHYGLGIQEKECKDLAESLLDAKHFSFKGHIKNENLLALYKTQPPYLIMNVSSSEGVPVSLMEAAAYGVLIMATDVGGTQDLVISNKTGFLIEENPSAESLSKTLAEILKLSKSDYTKLQIGAKKKLIQNFSADANYQSFAKAIRKRIQYHHKQNLE